MKKLNLEIEEQDLLVPGGWNCPSCVKNQKKGVLGVIHSSMIIVNMANEKTGEIGEEPARRRYRECNLCKDRFVSLETISHKVNKRG